MRMYVAALALSAGAAAPALADVVTSTPHSHDASPVTTFGTGPDDQHQHRTPHDPRAGTYSHIGNGNAYVATKVWNDRTQHAIAGGHDPFAHGHQDVAARWEMHVGTDTDPFPNDANVIAARARITTAFNTWVAVGNGSEYNYPDTDNDITTSYPRPNAQVIHRSMNWTRITDNTAHEVHVTWSNTGLNGAYAAYFPTLQTIRVNPNINWYFGTSTDPTEAPDQYDFLSVITHEVGHVVGLGHFGALGTHIMTDAADQPLRDGHFNATHGHAGGSAHVAGDGHAIPNPSALELAGGMFRSVDLDAEHGIRDLYSIPGLVPAPGSAALLGLGGLMALRRRRA